MNSPKRQVGQAQEQAVVDYYRSLESRLGYRLFLHGHKHLGWHAGGVPTKDMVARFKTIDEVAKRLKLQKKKKTLRLLDAGCGLGGSSRYLAKNYDVNVEGITVVPFEVEAAKRKSKTEQTRCSYSLMSYDALEFADESFDGIYTIETLSHAADIQKVFQEFYRVLKPGGRFVFFEYTMAPDERLSDKERAISDFTIQTGALQGMLQLRHGMFEKLLPEAGFTDVKVEKRTKEVMPSLRRLHRYAHIPSSVLRALHFVGPFKNTLVADIWYTLFEKDLWRFVVVTGTKPE